MTQMNPLSKATQSGSIKAQRIQDLQSGLDALPNLQFPKIRGRNGEELSTDEAAVWKRVLNFRIATYLKPTGILETHAGPGISTFLYRHAAPDALLMDHVSCPPPGTTTADLIDIDPFGQPWDTVAAYYVAIRSSRVVMVSNGEALAVARNLLRGQRYHTTNCGRRMPIWVVSEYIPRMEALLAMPCRFYYAFPTTVRTIHSRKPFSGNVFRGCPQWMWWLLRYSPGNQQGGDHE